MAIMLTQPATVKVFTAKLEQVQVITVKMQRGRLRLSGMLFMRI